MDVRAILLTGVAAPNSDAAISVNDSPELFAGLPMALLPVLGRPLIHQIADRLKQAGVDAISVVNAADPTLPLIEDAHRPDLKWKDVSSEQVWRAAEEEFDEVVQAGAELVIVMRLGPYAEIEIDPLLQFHLDERNHATQVIAEDGPIDVFVLSGSRRNDAAFLLRNKLTRLRRPAAPFLLNGYVNRLCTAADFRRLVLDSFSLKTCIRPLGEEVRPGIWMGAGAKIDRSVRLVAPCFIGSHARVRSGSLITRGSSIEHHSIVDCGTVVEASTLLPLSYIGAGLDLMHSVVVLKRIVSVKYAAQLEIEDSSLVSAVPSTSALRTLSHAANLITFVPRQMIRNLIGGRKLRKSQADAECPPPSFDPGVVTRPAVQDRQSLTSSVVAGMREYGNQ